MQGVLHPRLQLLGHLDRTPSSSVATAHEPTVAAAIAVTATIATTTLIPATHATARATTTAAYAATIAAPARAGLPAGMLRWEHSGRGYQMARERLAILWRHLLHRRGIPCKLRHQCILRRLGRRLRRLLLLELHRPRGAV